MAAPAGLYVALRAPSRLGPPTGGLCMDVEAGRGRALAEQGRGVLRRSWDIGPLLSLSLCRVFFWKRGHLLVLHPWWEDPVLGSSCWKSWSLEEPVLSQTPLDLFGAADPSCVVAQGAAVQGQKVRTGFRRVRLWRRELCLCQLVELLCMFQLVAQGLCKFQLVAQVAVVFQFWASVLPFGWACLGTEVCCVKIRCCVSSATKGGQWLTGMFELVSEVDAARWCADLERELGDVFREVTDPLGHGGLLACSRSVESMSMD